PLRCVGRAPRRVRRAARRRHVDLSMADKRVTEDDVVAELRDGMTIGIGGWGSRRKPMSLVRAIARSDLRDLTVVSYGGPDVGLQLTAAHALKLDDELVHMHSGDARGNGQYLNVDPYFDDLFCMAAPRAFMSVEQIVPTDDLASNGAAQTMRISRLMTHGVV